MKKLLFIFGSSFMLFFSFAPTVVLADCTNPTSTQEAIKCGADNAAGIDPNADAGKRINTTVNKVIDLLSVIVGIVAAIMIIWGGFKYITSAGNQENIKAAKNILLYAVIGLVVVALAQIIVTFVLKQTTS